VRDNPVEHDGRVWPVTDERQVRLRLDTREVSVPAGHGPEVVRYTGVTVERVDGGDLVEQAWIPAGPAPTYADDEALIAAWHDALRWSGTRADV
jgi:hypothetical protein